MELEEIQERKKRERLDYIKPVMDNVALICKKLRMNLKDISYESGIPYYALLNFRNKSKGSPTKFARLLLFLRYLGADLNKIFEPLDDEELDIIYSTYNLKKKDEDIIPMFDIRNFSENPFEI